MELNVHIERIDEALVAALFGVADWYTARGCFDRAEEIYLIVLDAQEIIWGPDSPASDETIDRIIDLLAREQESRLTQGLLDSADLDDLYDLSDPSLIMVALKV